MSRDACLELARSLGLDPDDVLEAWGERAAIRELDGGQPRDAAERDALEEVRAAFAVRKGPQAATPRPAQRLKKPHEG